MFNERGDCRRGINSLRLSNLRLRMKLLLTAFPAAATQRFFIILRERVVELHKFIFLIILQPIRVSSV